MSANTVTVTDGLGRETRLAADSWETYRDQLIVRNIENDPVAAIFAPGQWVSAIDDSRRADGSELAATGRLRELAAEVIAGYDAATARDRTPEDQAQLDDWRQRAGINP